MARFRQDLFLMKRIAPQSDEQHQVELVKKGDAAAFERLYRLNVRYLTAICSRYITDDEVVKDILQESFLKIYSSLWKFSYKGEGSLRAWMSKIVLNDTLKYLRDSGKTRFEELTADYQQPSDDVVERIPQEALFDMIRSLPHGYRTVFNLFVIEEKSYREISRLLKIKEGTVASQVHKAKALLAKKITDYERKMDR